MNTPTPRRGSRVRNVWELIGLTTLAITISLLTHSITVPGAQTDATYAIAYTSAYSVLAVEVAVVVAWTFARWWRMRRTS